MEKITQIDLKEMEPIVNARTKAIESADAAEKTLKDARLAELEFKVLVQQLYLNKSLDANCKVDISSGTVTWPDTSPVVEEIVADDVGDVSAKKRGKKA